MEKEYRSDREVYVQTPDTTTGDSGAGWAVALVVLILAIGFGFVVFSNNESMRDLRTATAIEEVKQNAANTLPTPAPVAAPQQIDVHMPAVNVPAPKAPAVPDTIDVNVNDNTDGQ